MRIAAVLALGAIVVAGGCASPASTPSALPSPASTAAAPATPTPAPSAPPSAIVDAKGWVACQCGVGTGETLFLMRADGSDEHQIFTDIAGDERHPDFSHDGRRMAFDRLPDESSPDEVWIADADGSQPKKLEVPCPVDGCLGFWEPAWSPDDTQIAAIMFGGPFTGTDVTSYGVVVIDVATGRAKLVAEQPSGKGQLHFPRWSPDGMSLVYWSESDTPSTWIVGADGGAPHQLTGPDLKAGDPDWSPDGRHIVVSTNPILHFDHGPTDLYTVEPDGANLTPLTDSGAHGIRYGQPRWSPDGKAILYTHVVDQRTIWAMSYGGGDLDGPIGASDPFQTHPVLQPTP